MSDMPLVPFLSQFFERRGIDPRAGLGTATFTKTNESGDVDLAADGPRKGSANALVLGTGTLTEVRLEQGDVDEPRRSRSVVLGTQTMTATNEQPDDDRSVRGRTASLGTETFTRTQEESDSDASGMTSDWTMFGARLI